MTLSLKCNDKNTVHGGNIFHLPNASSVSYGYSLFPFVFFMNLNHIPIR